VIITVLEWDQKAQIYRDSLKSISIYYNYKTFSIRPESIIQALIN